MSRALFPCAFLHRTILLSCLVFAAGAALPHLASAEDVKDNSPATPAIKEPAIIEPDAKAPADSKPARASASGKIAGKAGSVAKKAKLALRKMEQNIIDRTNEQRRRNGLSALKMSSGLMHSARSHAQWMASANTLQHTRAMVAENIAMGQTSSRQAVQDWMNSPGHRANILNGSYRTIGVAAFRSGNGSWYWCQQFR